MTISKTEQIDLLKNLAGVCEDGRVFYTQAAKKTDDASLEKVFTDMGRQRMDVCQSLIGKIREMGGTVEEQPRTAKGKWNMLYGEVLASLSPNSDKTFVNQLEECEDRVLEEFSDAIGQTIPASLKDFIYNQHRILQDSHDYMKSLKDHMEEKKAA